MNDLLTPEELLPSRGLAKRVKQAPAEGGEVGHAERQGRAWRLGEAVGDVPESGQQLPPDGAAASLQLATQSILRLISVGALEVEGQEPLG